MISGEANNQYKGIPKKTKSNRTEITYCCRGVAPYTIIEMLKIKTNVKTRTSVPRS